jgi:hypothetical protein
MLLSNLQFIGLLFLVALALIIVITLLVYDKKARIITFSIAIAIVVGVIMASCSYSHCPTYSGAYKAQEIKYLGRK